MKSTVVIKGNKSGMTVILDPEVAYETLLLDIASKFEESAKFWGSAQMTLTLAGRPLTPEQEFEIVNVITEHSQIEILCLVDQDINRIRRCERALKNRLMELSSNTGQFFRGNLKAGELLETETSLVVIGDVERGDPRRSAWQCDCRRLRQRKDSDRCPGYGSPAAEDQ